jgi:NADH dehydrogenase
MYLVGWGNRIGTIYTWMRSLWFSRNRGHRVITFESARDEVAEGRTLSGRPSPVLPRTADEAPRTSRTG